MLVVSVLPPLRSVVPNNIFLVSETKVLTGNGTDPDRRRFTHTGPRMRLVPW